MERFDLDDRCEKLLRLALDPGAAAGESRNAFLLLLKLARASGVQAQAVIEAMRTSPKIVEKIVKVTVPDPDKPFPWEGVVMPFGKFRGWKLVDIAKSHPDYIRWSIDNLTSAPESLMDSMFGALDWIEGN